MSRETIPVTVLSGTLGAGKTTALNGLPDTRTDLDTAGLVNDTGEVNVDAEHVAEHPDISEDDAEPGDGPEEPAETTDEGAEGVGLAD